MSKDLLSKDSNECPFLILAPMEGVGDQCFRKAIASIGGFDEAVTDFLRVPKNAHVESLAKRYDSNELGTIPIAAQVMGSDPELMAEMVRELQRKGAKRIDLNCGCPSNTVTGRGAGSSLLKDPRFLYEVARAMVLAVEIPVSIKMRSGYEDTSLFRENLKAAEEAGVCFVALHPRTKLEGYRPPAHWELIAEAKSILKIPVVGNGDINSVEDALKMLKETSCDALMIGRASVVNPFIFHQIRAHFAKEVFQPTWKELLSFLQIYSKQIDRNMKAKVRVNKLKQLMGFLFKSTPALEEKRVSVLRSQCKDPESFFQFSLPLLEEGWKS